MWWSSATTSPSQPPTSLCDASANVSEYEEKAMCEPKHWFAQPESSNKIVPSPERRVIAGTENRLRTRMIGGCHTLQERASFDMVSPW
mmetsp:Transcript_68246/g.190480  ORF Transcript_68246/g.190480 Transcript_68246/m.190480 type:complete len:88 (+) Transcript_68246:1088-1351(+)